MRFYSALIVASLLNLAPAGCVLDQPKVWVEQSEEFAVPAGSLEGLILVTHNGKISVAGEEGRDDIVVTVHRKAGGKDEASASACLEAITVQSAAEGDTEHKISWTWATPKHRDWGAEVSYRVQMPARFAVNATTHNGAITARGIEGACAAKTHNGAVDVSAGAAPLTIRTHNGKITASSAASRVDLETHNGGVELDAAEAKALGGRVVTHNGAIRLIVGPDTDTELICKTRIGGISCDAPWHGVEKTKRSAKGTLGNGGSELVAETHNGGISIKQAGS
jgi:hypothetical protein